MRKRVFIIYPTIMLLMGCNSSNTSSNSQSSQIDTKQNIIEKLKSDLSLDIQLTKSKYNVNTHEQTDIEISNMKTYISSNEYWNYETKNDVVLNESHYFKNEDGKVIKKKISIDNKSIVEEEVLLYGQTIDYDLTYANPFNSLTVDNLIKTNNDDYEINLSEQDKKYAHGVITLYQGTIDSIFVNVNQNQLTLNYQAFFDEFSQDIKISFEIKATLKSKDDLNVKQIKIKQHIPEHDVLQEKINLLKKQSYAFTYVQSDPEGLISDKKYDVIVNENLIYVKSLKDGIIKEFGMIDFNDGYYTFDVVKQDDKIIFQANAPLNKGYKVKDVLVDFKMSSELFDYNNGVYTLETGLGLYDYLESFLPNQCIVSNADSVDENSFKMTLNDNKMQIDYTYSFNLWREHIEITQFENAVIPYENFEILEYDKPTSWKEIPGFYNDFVIMMGSKEMVDEVPFIYPINGWDNAICMPELNLATLTSKCEDEKAAKDIAIDYMMTLINNGYMLGEELDTYEKTINDKTISITAYASNKNFIINITLK